MSYDILTIALILYYAVMFVFAILYLNDWRCYLLGLGHIKKTIKWDGLAQWESRTLDYSAGNI